MIYTITLNPALDKTVVIPSFRAGAVNRVQDIRYDPGGKGINVSKNLQVLGRDSLALVALAGPTGEKIADMLKAQGIDLLALPAEGQTRTNLKISDPVCQMTTDINEPGSSVSRQSICQLECELKQRLRAGDSLVLAGSVPSGLENIYRHLGSIGRNAGARVFLDADGQALAAGVQAQPFLIKPNLQELSELTGCDLKNEQKICESALRLVRTGINYVAVSLGADGLMLISADQVLIAAGLTVQAVSTVGAGDAVMAAFVAGFSRDDMLLPELIQLAAGAGTASVMSPGSHPPHYELIEQMAARISVITRPLNTKVRYNDGRFDQVNGGGGS